MSSGIHIRAISLEIPQASGTEINLKTTYVKFQSDLPGANELTHLARGDVAVISNAQI